MTTVQGQTYQYSANPTQQSGPSSPFNRTNNTNNGTNGPTQTSAPGDTLQTSGTPRGAIAAQSFGLLRDEQSKFSPFRRVEGGDPEQATTMYRDPSTTAPAQPNKLIFYYPKDPHQGPAEANVQQTLQQEIAQVQTPEQAIQLIAMHSANAKSEREMANRVTWGAKLHAVQAAEIAEKALAEHSNLSPQQVQAHVGESAKNRDQAISLLNEAKKRSITVYNEALKANLLYNHFFTSTGGMVTSIDDNTREMIKAELDDAWTRWDGQFAKEWQGQMVQADGAALVIDKTHAEVAEHLHRMNSILSQINQ